MPSLGFVPDNIRRTFYDSMRSQSAFESAINAVKKSGADEPVSSSTPVRWGMLALTCLVVPAVAAFLSKPAPQNPGRSEEGETH